MDVFLSSCLKGKICHHKSSGDRKCPSPRLDSCPPSSHEHFVEKLDGDLGSSSISLSLTVRTICRKISLTRSWLGSLSFQPRTGITSQTRPRYRPSVFRWVRCVRGSSFHMRLSVWSSRPALALHSGPPSSSFPNRVPGMQPNSESWTGCLSSSPPLPPLEP